MKELELITEGLYIADNPDTFVSRRIFEADLEFGGIAGDRHFGMVFAADSRQPMYPRGTLILNRRQISIVSVEECSLIAKELGIESISPESLGANMLLSGMTDLTLLPRGARLLFPSGAGLICEGENKPCIHAGKMVQQDYPSRSKLDAAFVIKAKKRRGIVCSVERPGKVQQGDKIRVYLP